MTNKLKFNRHGDIGEARMINNIMRSKITNNLWDKYILRNVIYFPQMLKTYI